MLMTDGCRRRGAPEGGKLSSERRELLVDGACYPPHHYLALSAEVYFQPGLNFHLVRGCYRGVPSPVLMMQKLAAEACCKACYGCRGEVLDASKG